MAELEEHNVIDCAEFRVQTVEGLFGIIFEFLSAEYSSQYTCVFMRFRFITWLNIAQSFIVFR